MACCFWQADIDMLITILCNLSVCCLTNCSVLVYMLCRMGRRLWWLHVSLATIRSYDVCSRNLQLTWMPSTMWAPSLDFDLGWPLNTLNHLNFCIFYCLMHLRNWRSQRLQIWCKGWMCKSQPNDDRLFLIGAMVRLCDHYKILGRQSYHWNGWT